MTKQLKVDVKKSLGFKTNGRIKPASKKEIANLKAKFFTCPECNNQETAELTQFGEEFRCPKCNAVMQEQL